MPVAVAVIGLLLSVLLVRKTEAHVQKEMDDDDSDSQSTKDGNNENDRETESPPFRSIFWRITWQDRSLRAASQAGLATNLKDGLMWGLLPVLLSSEGLSMDQVGAVAAVYPAAWGFCQLATGPLSDRWGRKWLIVAGMIIQAAGVALFAASSALWQWIATAIVIGLGTAAVYPTLLAAVTDVAEPAWRASVLGVYRLWRDMGYALAGIGVGLLADATGVRITFAAVSGIVFASGLIVLFTMSAVGSTIS